MLGRQWPTLLSFLTRNPIFVDSPSIAFERDRIVILVMAILFFSACSSTPSVTFPPDDEPFRANGYTVQGDFLRFFHIYGGVESLGLPLTSEIIVDGWRVQYFERGRLEYHPENEATYRVTVGWLGDLLHRRRPPIPPAAIPPANAPYRRYYPQTGHTISGDFLKYFDDNGGSVRFGLPISEPFLWEGRLTQDFQSARFFWHPADSPPVRLEDTGRVHLSLITAESDWQPK